MEDKLLITFEVDAKKIARIASNARPEQVSTQEGEHFMALYSSDINEILAERLRQFVVGKFQRQ